MSNEINIKIQSSRIYLILSLATYLLVIFAAWHYFYVLWLSVILSILLFVWLFYFLHKTIWLTHPNSIIKVSLDNDKLTLEKNDKSIQQFYIFHTSYQSQFLIIISAGKESIVIFKDALASQSLSQLNRYFNTKVNANI